MTTKPQPGSLVGGQFGRQQANHDLTSPGVILLLLRNTDTFAEQSVTSGDVQHGKVSVVPGNLPSSSYRLCPSDASRTSGGVVYPIHESHRNESDSALRLGWGRLDETELAVHSDCELGRVHRELSRVSGLVARIAGDVP